MSSLVLRRFPQLLAAALCVGLAAANAARVETTAVLLLAGLLVLVSIVVEGWYRVGTLVLALALGGWWWGSARLDARSEERRVGKECRL